MGFKMRGYSAFTKKTDLKKKKAVSAVTTPNKPIAREHIAIENEKKSLGSYGNRWRKIESKPTVTIPAHEATINEDVVREKDKYPKGKPRYWKNLKYKVTKNPKHLKK